PARPHQPDLVPDTQLARWRPTSLPLVERVLGRRADDTPTCVQVQHRRQPLELPQHPTEGQHPVWLVLVPRHNPVTIIAALLVPPELLDRLRPELALQWCPGHEARLGPGPLGDLAGGPLGGSTACRFWCPLMDGPAQGVSSLTLVPGPPRCPH